MRLAETQFERKSRWNRGTLTGLQAITVVAFVFASLLGFALPTTVQQGKPSEYQVKAVYLYNFGKFVQWPATQPANTFTICVLGQDPFGKILDDTITGETIDGQRLMAKRIDQVENAAGCRILFISALEENRVINILEALQSKPVLTVSDMADFCDRGGMIQFVFDSNKVRFRVNLAPADKSGLMLSSQLLKVATSVRRGP